MEESKGREIGERRGKGARARGRGEMGEMGGGRKREEEGGREENGGRGGGGERERER